MSSTSFGFTPLVEPSSNVSQTVPSGFNSDMAYLLGQCCSLTYTQYAAGTGWTPDFSSLTALGANNLTASNAVAFTVCEGDGPGTQSSDPGTYITLPCGFAVTLTQANPVSGTPTSFVVIALRGTQTWQEWMDDADAFPALWHDIADPIEGKGTVHSGFFSLYTVGTDGASSDFPFSTNPSSRPSGSIAQQVAQYVSNLSTTSPLPIYVTGHSLGGALAAICAFDVATYFSSNASGVSMYSLASPRVAVGLSTFPCMASRIFFSKTIRQPYRIAFGS